MQSENTAAAAFGRRLRELMRAQRHTSDTARSGVDVASLSAATGISYEMARRYAEGKALPRPEVLERIAEWLGVAPALLAWGASEEQGVNAEVLQQCIAAVMDAQARAGEKAASEKAAALVAALYLEAMDGRPPVPAMVARMLRAMK